MSTTRRADLLDDLDQRGLIQDSTDIGALRQRLSDAPIGVYCGFDPTADSLHVGHLLGQLTLRRFQLAGHRPIALAGGATGMIGDPSGRSEERNLLDRDTLAANLAKIKGQLERLLDFDAGPVQARLVDNYSWTSDVALLDFLRDVGKHFTVNQMVARESVRARMESTDGISYTEFSYMLLQANDFAWLCAHADCEMQVGGSDQWGNILSGIELIRRTQGRAAYGLTWPLLLKEDGAKFGKTAEGAVWLDPARTSPYRFHQFWVQSGDDVVDRYLRQFTTLAVEEIVAVVAEHRSAPERRVAQRRLAHEVTTLVHGPAATRQAEAAAEVLFGGDPAAASPDTLETIAAEIPGTTLDAGQLEGGVSLVSLLVTAGLATSNGDARRTLAGGGISLNGHRVADGGERTVGPADLLHGRYLLLRKGRSSYALVRTGPRPSS